MRKLKTPVADMVAAARARIEEIETADALAMAGDWFAFHARSPYSAATMGALVSVAATIIVSRIRPS